MLIDEKTREAYCKILYNDLRSIFNMSDKLYISNIVCIAQHDHIKFADLLYGGKDLKYWVENTNNYFKQITHTEDIMIEMSIDDNMNNCFDSLKASLKNYFEFDGYFKALYDKDEFALVTWEIVQIVEKFNIDDVINEIKGGVNNV